MTDESHELCALTALILVSVGCMLCNRGRVLWLGCLQCGLMGTWHPEQVGASS